MNGRKSQDFDDTFGNHQLMKIPMQSDKRDTVKHVISLHKSLPGDISYSLEKEHSYYS